MGDCFEVRFGGFLHSEGAYDEITHSIGASFVTPRPGPLPGYWANFLPRLRVGGILDLQRGTSYAYADILVTLPIAAGFFFEPFFGGATHNGNLAPTQTSNGLGCPLLFHIGGSVGYAIAPHWNVLVTMDHLSNGNEIGVNCGTNLRGQARNQGINNYGAGIAYAF
jgi:hypothetical protein